MSRLLVDARAKVNFSLEILGKRPDGFHEVRSVMVSIDASDQLILEPAAGLSLECELRELDGEGNLALRAARALQAATGYPGGAHMVLRKGIPVASGLGGASADAAAALVGLAQLWGIDAGARLGSLAGALGSDVPFFLRGGAALVTGRGEQVQPLPDAQPWWLVLMVPPHSLAAKTAALYRLLRPEHWTPGERTTRLAEAIVAGRPVAEDLLGNAFETVAGLAFPGLAEHREAMVSAGAARVHLSGAGPALFSSFESRGAANSVAARLAGDGYHPLVARTLSADEATPRPRPVEIE